MQRGFTLFTALVAAMVVFLGILVMQTMIRGERSSVEIVDSVEEEAQMLDFANLRRADAVQEFNFGLRSAFEKYFSKETAGSGPDGLPDNWFEINSADLSGSTRIEQWEQLKKEFIKQHFGDIGENCIVANPLDLSSNVYDCKAKNFVSFTASEIKNALSIEKIVGPYKSEINQLNNPEYDERFKRILRDIFARSAQRNDFLEVANCNGDYATGCEGGGFYINLDFGPLDSSVTPTTGISDEVFEALPQIIVQKFESCDVQTRTKCTKVLKQPIFPRSTLRIFVPTRIFKAIAGAHEIIFSQANGSKTIFDKASDFKKTISGVKLGVCDTNPNFRVRFGTKPKKGPDTRLCTQVPWDSCAPRTSFESAQSQGGFGKACSLLENEQNSNLFLPSQKLTSVSLAGSITYNPNNDVSMHSAINQYLGSTVLPRLFNRSANEGIRIIEDSASTDFELLKDPETSQYFWNALKDTATNQYFWKVAIAPSYPSRAVFFAGREVGISACAKVSSIDTTLVFRENNPQYRISLLQDTKFAIRIIDSGFDAFGKGDHNENWDETKPVKCTTSPLFTCPDPNPYANLERC